VSRNSRQLGLGLIGIGKPWGHAPKPVPSEAEARGLLEFAYELGIRYFDTAPSYGDGVSEERLGCFLRSLTAEQRAGVTAATKFGEHWDRLRDEPYADHSREALRRSLDGSVERLGRIEILQLHKTTPAALRSADVGRGWEYARSLGIARLGPSVSDLESARMAVEAPEFALVQLPLNRANTTFAPVLEAAARRGMWVAVNRPFAMGQSVGAEAFRFILEYEFPGVVLTGSTSREHLRQNREWFCEATQGHGSPHSV
jgi:aryl-alcohol dehydrogenase-like predicted oxidoreductase